MKFIYSKYFIYPIFLLTILSLYAILSQVLGTSKSKLRDLTEDGLEELCKTNEDIYNYYYKTEDYNVYDRNFGKIDTKSQIILDFINDNFDTKYIFEYIFHTDVYVFFLILLVIIIILTIYYSIASCIRCCTEKCCDLFSFTFCKNKYLKKTACILIPFIYFIVFIFSFISIILIIGAIQRLSGVVCVGIQLVDSFIEGEIRQSNPKWAGIEIVSGILDRFGSITNETLAKTINKNNQDYLNSFIEWRDSINDTILNYSVEYFPLTSPKMTKADDERVYNITPEYSYEWVNILINIYNYDLNNDLNVGREIDTIQSSLYGFLGCYYDNNSIFKCDNGGSLSPIFKSAADTVRKLKDPISSIKEKITTPVRNIYDQINSTILVIFVIIMIFVIFYCIIIEILLAVFCCAKNCKCFGCFIKWVLCFIYYTSIFIIIIGFVLGIAIGFIGDLVTNLTQVVKFISSSDNLLDNNPKIFGSNSYTEYLDVCINGNGNMAEKLGLVDGFDKIENISEINDTQKYINETKDTSPIINYYLQYFNGLEENYLNITYIRNDTNSEFSIKERIDEINKYVSGGYAKEIKETCNINETWDIVKEKNGYIRNVNYSEANIGDNYLLYLYEKDLYSKIDFEHRYDQACTIKPDVAYSTVNEASKEFSKFFKEINDTIFSDKYYNNYTKYLNELNNMFSKKNKYLKDALGLSYQPIKNIMSIYHDYASSSSNIFNLLNCKFIGDNVIILMDILHTSLGVYLDAFGIITCLLNLFIFIGIVFILIIIKNSKLEDKNGTGNMDIESLNNILKGNDEVDTFSSNGKTQELVPVQ